MTDASVISGIPTIVWKKETNKNQETKNKLQHLTLGTDLGMFSTKEVA